LAGLLAGWPAAAERKVGRDLRRSAKEPLAEARRSVAETCRVRALLRAEPNLGDRASRPSRADLWRRPPGTEARRDCAEARKSPADQPTAPPYPKQRASQPTNQPADQSLPPNQPAS